MVVVWQWCPFRVPLSRDSEILIGVSSLIILFCSRENLTRSATRGILGFRVPFFASVETYSNHKVSEREMEYTSTVLLVAVALNDVQFFSRRVPK